MAIAAALISLFRGKPIQPNLAMTGEVTLTGRVLPVGGVREKILAARRAGIKSVLIPRHNEKDLVEIPAEVKADLTFQLVDTLDDVVLRLFPKDSRNGRHSPPDHEETRPTRQPGPAIPPRRRTGLGSRHSSVNEERNLCSRRRGLLWCPVVVLRNLWLTDESPA